MALSYATGICPIIGSPNTSMYIDMDNPNCQQPQPDYGQVVIAFINGILDLLGNALNWLMGTIFSALFYAPDITPAKGMYDNILKLAQSLYSLLIAALGLYWIWGARGFDGRVKAKAWTEKLFVLMLVQSVGFPLFGLGVGLNNEVVGYVSSLSDPGYFPVEAIAVAALALVVRLFMLPLLFLTLLTLILRQLMVFVMLVFFPFTLMLYMTPATNKWGSFAISLTAVVIFMGAIDAIILYASAALGNLTGFFITDAIIKAIASYGTFGLIGILNVWMLLTSTQGGKVVNVVGMVG